MRRALTALLTCAVLAATATAGVADTTHTHSAPAVAGRASAPQRLLSGPDVSSNNHGVKTPIHWGQVASGGRAFTIVKASGENGYTNPWFRRDWAAAGKAGLVRAAYHFALPTRRAGDAVAAAHRFVATVAGVGGLHAAGTLPLVLDLEKTGGLRPAALQTWTRQFLSTVTALSGRTPLIYTYPDFWTHEMGNSNAFTAYPLWIASYTAVPPDPLPGGWQSWTLWQYTSRGRITGVKGGVDLSVFCCSAQTLATLAEGRPLPVVTAWLTAGGLTGPLGAPLDALTNVTSGTTTASYEDFAGGSIYAVASGVITLSGPTLARYQALGGPAGPLGLPTATTYGVTTFAGGALAAANNGSVAFILAGPILDRWSAEGGPASLLGAPTADPSSVTDGTEALFAGGAILSSPDRGTHELTGQVLLTWLAAGGPDSSYGMPSSDVYATSTGTQADFGPSSIAG